MMDVEKGYLIEEGIMTGHTELEMRVATNCEKSLEFGLYINLACIYAFIYYAGHLRLEQQPTYA